MADLSQITPPVPLGALDGRYRPAVAPLVNQLSEAALNRARLVVEVGWLIHLTETGSLPGAPRLTEAEKRYLADVVETFGADEIDELAAIEARWADEVGDADYATFRRVLLSIADQPVARA